MHEPMTGSEVPRSGDCTHRMWQFTASGLKLLHFEEKIAEAHYPANDTDAMPHLPGSSVSYRIAVGSQQSE